MTLALKEFGKLETAFYEQVRIALKTKDEKNKDMTVEDIPKIVNKLEDPRRSQFLFLINIMTQLKAHNAEKGADLTNSAKIFYGAMMLVSDQIDSSTHAFQSTDHSQLNNGMKTVCFGEKKDEKPSPKQVAEFNSALSNYLSLIYVENNSRKGLAKNHILDTLDAKILSSLVFRCYELDEISHNLYMTSLLPATGQTIPEANHYKIKKPFEQSGAKAHPYTFDQLAKGFQLLKEEELAAYKKSSVRELKIPRCTQLGYIEELIKNLTPQKDINEAEKTAILAGAMHFVRIQINSEYPQTVALLNADEIPKGLLTNGSKVHSSLTKLLQASKSPVEDVAVLIAASNRYMQHLTVQLTGERIKVDATKSVPAEKDSIRTKHVFSDVVGFDVNAQSALTRSYLRACRFSALQHCGEAVEAENKAGKKSASSKFSSIVSNLSIFRSKTGTNTSKYEEVLAHAAQQAATNSSATSNP